MTHTHTCTCTYTYTYTYFTRTRSFVCFPLRSCSSLVSLLRSLKSRDEQWSQLSPTLFVSPTPPLSVLRMHANYDRSAAAAAAATAPVTPRRV